MMIINSMDAAVTTLNSKINKTEVLSLALQGLTGTAIAKQLGCHNSYISKVLSPYRDALLGYLAHKENPENLWEFKEYLVLSSVEDDDIKKASLRDKGIFAGTARDKVNIERGKGALIPTNMTFIVVNHGDNQPDKCKDNATITVNSDDNTPKLLNNNNS